MPKPGSAGKVRSSGNLREASGNLAASGLANDSGLVRMASFNGNIRALSVAPVKALQDARDHLKTDIANLEKRITLKGGFQSYDGSRLTGQLNTLKKQLSLVEQQL